MTEHVLFGLYLGCVVGGLLPWVNAEVMVIGVAVLVDPGELPFVPLVAACGQMTSKGGLYALARWAPDRLPERARRALDRARTVATGPVRTVLTLLASASVGVPPLYLVTLAAGLMRIPILLFLGSGFVGMALRYVVLARGAVAVEASAFF